MKMWPAASGDLAPWFPGTSGRRGSAVQGWLIQCARTAQHKPRPIMRIEVPLISQDTRDAGPRAPHAPRPPAPRPLSAALRHPGRSPSPARSRLSSFLGSPHPNPGAERGQGQRPPETQLAPPGGGHFRPPEREDTGLWCFVTAASYVRCPDRYLGSRVPRHPPRHNPRVQRRADRCTDHARRYYPA